MDAVLETESPVGGKSVSGFFKTIFNTSRPSQIEILNAIQFSLLSLAPSYSLLRLLREYVPEPDPDKGTLELSVEVLMQVGCMVLGIILIDRAVLYIPTLSGAAYGNAPNTLLPLLPFIIVLLTMQTKLGAKVDILYSRLTDAQAPKIAYDNSADHQHREPTPDYLPREGFQTQHPGLAQHREKQPSPADRALADSPLAQTNERSSSASPQEEPTPDNFSFDQGGNAGSLSFTSF